MLTIIHYKLSKDLCSDVKQCPVVSIIGIATSCLGFKNGNLFKVSKKIASQRRTRMNLTKAFIAVSNDLAVLPLCWLGLINFISFWIVSDSIRVVCTPVFI